MTATRDRHSDLDDDHVEPAWDERPIFGTSRGLPWWGAVLLAFGLALVAAVIDIQRQDTLGKIYQGAYILGCVAAVCLVRRRNLFGPIVQPPLVFAVTAVGTIMALSAKSADGGLKAQLFKIALPLTSNFPTMGITTAVVLAIGLGRLFLQRDPDPKTSARKRPADDDDDVKPRPARPRPDEAADDPFDEVPVRRPRPPQDDRRRTPRPRTGEDRRPRPAEDRPRDDRRTADRPARDDRTPRRGDPRPAREDRPRRPRDEDRPRPPRDRAADPNRPREDRGPKRQPPRRPRPEDR
ncbi:DUF6542 domain-containing protein [Actinokineospora sp. HUAS TT18]|uniref:DUF6542 domain-containing protein n=1 Tax=Actinokineospora sp. HUAS TT18 TaxID=3447451 RepID=UPI003F51D81C